MKESPHITLTEEQDKRDTIQCIVWASVVVFGMLALLCHGLAFLSWTEPTMEEYHARRNMARNIDEILYDIKSLRKNHENHTHGYFNGKIRQEVVK